MADVGVSELKRRAFCLRAGAAAFGTGVLSGPYTSAATDRIPELTSLEKRVGGRIGLSVLDTRSGKRLTHRATERFAMCSTFKWVLAAAVLARIDRGTLTSDQRLTFTRQELLGNSPVTSAHVVEGSLSIHALCEAAVEVSDNTATNMLLTVTGGPPTLTQFVRGISDTTTRFDRFEPTLNSNFPGDPRDTTTPAAMSALMQTILTGTVLSAVSLEMLLGWMKGCQTGLHRLRAGLPETWLVGDKTGTGSNGAANDNAIVWPPQRSPVLIAAYLSDSSAASEVLDAAHALIGRLVGLNFT